MSPNKNERPGRSGDDKGDNNSDKKKDGSSETNVFPDNESSRKTPSESTGNDKDDNKGIMSDINGPADESDN